MSALRVLVVGVILMAATAVRAGPVAPTTDEMKVKDEWVRQNLAAKPAEQPGPGVVVIANHGNVGKDARGKGPLRLGKTEYKRGLFCHAPSLLAVRLPSPGKAFTAKAGIDTNDQTSGGRGSVIFAVNVAGKDVVKSGVVREGMPPLEVSADLRGETVFILEIGDAGDGISCDQAEWADAKVILADGKEMYLSDLPVAEPTAGGPLISFVYDGRPSQFFLSSWARKQETRDLDKARAQHAITWTDAATGLEVRLIAVEYRDFPAVEWTAYLKNTGQAPTPILSDVQGMDLEFRRAADQFVLRTIRGDDCSAASYQPIEIRLDHQAKDFAPAGGRPTNGAFPCFNVETAGEGFIAALGWPGQWSARFWHEGPGLLRVRGGQERTHLSLAPGEEIRTPLAVLLFWKSDYIRSQNLWRRWMVAHNLPRPGGNLPGQLFSTCMGLHQSAAGEIGYIDMFAKNGVKFDYWWMDAGWYAGPSWWDAKGVGTWTPDPERFPRGVKAVSDHAHSKGMKMVLWFEPERAYRGSWVWENHPEWLLKWDDASPIRLLNLGNPEARRWLTDHIDKFLTEQGIDLYRQDFNVDPLGAWRKADAEDRQGVTENFHVQGYLAWWDELLRRHPDMLIDSCASGGRRNDLETLRRAVPLLRSDFQAPATSPKPADIDTGNQCQTYGLSLWIPYYGSGVAYDDVYSLRSHTCPALGIGWTGEKTDWDAFRRRVADYRKMADFFYGDYYPLTPYSRENSAWIGWQFNRPEQGDGMIQVFRRAESPYESAHLRLRGLAPEARYAAADLDTGRTTEATGRELMTDGLPLTIRTPRTAVVLLYKQLR
jgi:alpha-galactosidase